MGAPTDNTTYIYRQGTSPNTRAVISQRNKIYGYAVDRQGFQQIGVASEFSHEESKSMEVVRGIGFGDQIAELVPGNTQEMGITINKTLLYALNIFQSLGYKGGVSGLVRSLKHHRWPFDIKQEIVISELSSAQDLDGVVNIKDATKQPNNVPNMVTNNIKALFTFFEACWLESYSVSYSADSALVAENSSIKASDVIDGVSIYGEYIDSGLSPVAANGAAGKGFSLRYAGNSNVNQANLI